jgi:soluble lytic murein transglycosylase
VLTKDRGQPRTRDRHQARLLLGDLALGAGDHERIIATHRALLRDGVGDTGALRFNLMRAYEALGREHAARAQRNWLLINLPRHPASLGIIQMRGRGILDELSDRDRLKRVKRLLKVSRPREAAREVTSIPRPPFANAFTVELEEETVRALVRAGRMDEALSLADKLKATQPPQARWWAVGAWALGKAGRQEEASALWKETAALSKGPEPKAEACFFSGFHRYEASRYADAEEIWKACHDVVKGSAWQEATLWYRGLSALLLGRFDWAAGLWDQLILHHPASRELSKFLYWRARALFQLDQRAEAKKLLTRIWQNDPLGYYGILAREKLGKKSLGGTAVSPDALIAHAGRAQKKWARKARALARFGFAEDARAEVLANRPMRHSHMGLLQEVGAHHDVWKRAGRVRPSPQVRGPRLAKGPGWRATYAEPHSALVNKAAADHSIPPEFIYAIMRTESGFDAQAKSPVGALGLMQLMPYTARGMAGLLATQLPDPIEPALVEPGLSIHLGAGFLGRLNKELGHPLLAAAAYNGSPQEVTRWMNDFGHLAPLLFVERMPFLETRNYVKKVLATQAVYRGLAGRPVALDLPAEPVGRAPEKFTAFAPVEADP